MSENPYSAPADRGRGDDDSKLGGVLSPLLGTRGMMRVAGILMIVFGALSLIGIWTIIIAWIPIWMGILLVKAAGRLDDFSRDGSDRAAREAVRGVATFFRIMAILLIVYVCLIGLIFLGALAFGLAMPMMGHHAAVAH